MSVLPIRKCISAARAATLTVLMVGALLILRTWYDHRRAAPDHASLNASPSEVELERQVLLDETLQRVGAEGAADTVTDARAAAEARRRALNVFLSDRTPYNRTIPDHRHEACSRVRYPAMLPSASVVVVFHNEPYSVLVRTVWSVLNSARRSQPWYKASTDATPPGYQGQETNSTFVYLREVVLVDDASTEMELSDKLAYYVRTRLPPIVQLLRLPQRAGLMAARMTGARAARGDVLVFLDAHCEAGADWLRPLLARVLVTRTAVVSPVIDVIDQTTFRLEAADDFQAIHQHDKSRPGGRRANRRHGCGACGRGRDSEIKNKNRKEITVASTPAALALRRSETKDLLIKWKVGGFTFSGHFVWIGVSERERRRRDGDINPTWSPAMAGGLFAMRRDYFWELGGYDELMTGWGGENLEMSFRVWQCGGTLEVLACSRVGHVFRAYHPYALPAPDTHGANTARAAAVWMDEYAELLYLYRPDLRVSTHQRRVLCQNSITKIDTWP
ncbi:Polypeptide N-acetylgalactosaminyltransferase 10 [Eumeta japonica]|uniref:Polypeptide N-acetylgalactosaminyltransferase 10 n=1 Tax=Eumeta variegata TaxID=151549 RepID=A0A4C1YQI3_EUMVA|nr:Polypeptide N-acetylgalactosaminyltransferase 10 [Eumeta japonica]